MPMKKTISYGISMLVALAASMLLPVVADNDYTFIISGYPAQNKSYSLATAGTALITSTRSSVTLAVPLEARYRTICASNTSALRTDKVRGTILILR